MPGEVDPEHFASAPFAQFLSDLGAKSPAPGGGAAAGAVGALGAALGRMVVSYSEGRKSLAEHHDLLDDAGPRLERARDLFLALAAEDAAAYAALSALQSKPEDDAERVANEPGAIEACLAAPRATLAAASDTLRLLEELCGRSNAYLRSDLAIAGVLAEAAAAAAAWNVRVNLGLVDDARANTLADETERSVRAARDARERIERACAGSDA
ncbi:MAG: cyclodeaminase/cyclohydrolase family protein [Phycisphaerales bacterium]